MFLPGLRSAGMEEFYVTGSSLPDPIKVNKGRWHWAAWLALLPLLCFVPGPSKPQFAITLTEHHGQMRISWNVPTRGTMTIRDGFEQSFVPITPDQSSITYTRRSGDVTVGIDLTEARFIGTPLPLNDVEQARATLASLKTKIVTLRETQALARTKLAILENVYNETSARQR